MIGRGTQHRRCRIVFSFFVVVFRGAVEAAASVNKEEEPLKLLLRRRASHTTNHNPYWDLPGQGETTADATSSPSHTTTDDNGDGTLWGIPATVEVLDAAVNDATSTSSPSSTTPNNDGTLWGYPADVEILQASIDGDDFVGASSASTEDREDNDENGDNIDTENTDDDFLTDSPSSTPIDDDYWKLPPGHPLAGGTEVTEEEEGASAHVEVLDAAVNEKDVNSTTGDRLDNDDDSVIIDTNTENNDNNEDLQSDLLGMQQDARVDQCLMLLESHSKNMQVDRDAYVDFLMELSKNSLQVTEFHELPLFLSMIFFSAACTSGEDCVTQEPALTLHSRDSRENQLNNLLCVQLIRFPFLEIIMPFQFLVRVGSDVTASEVLLVNETNQVVPMLEAALDEALLNGFNCPYVPGEPVPLRRENEKRKQDFKDRSQRRHPQPQQDCDFVVEVRVDDAADYPCGLDNSCILIFSDVSVFAVVNETLDEPTLRSLTTTVLRDAINGDALNIVWR